MIEALTHAHETGTLHHAYIVRASHLPESLFGFFLTITAGNRHNIVLHESDQLSVDDARALRTTASRAADGVRVVAIQTGAFSTASQNALLKVLEEPVAGVYFFLVLAPQISVLETVSSRCIELPPYIEEQDGVYASLADMPYVQRKKQIAAILKEDDARVRAQEMLGAECRYARTHANHVLPDIAWAQTLLSQPGSSPKLILEHLIAIL